MINWEINCPRRAEWSISPVNAMERFQKQPESVGTEVLLEDATEVSLSECHPPQSNQPGGRVHLGPHPSKKAKKKRNLR